MSNFSNEDTIAAGWGLMNTSVDPIPYPFPTILHAVKQTVVDPAECWETHHVNYNLGHMCAGGEEGMGICGGDSGGPLLWKGSFEPNISSRNYLLGITSIMLAKCATKGVPAVYQRITLLMKWILDNMRA
uniref:Serine proteases 1/2 n=1 Tax=Cacopsylla melanoneura TaxID=428564 RepID=A0A8D8Z3D5_9HEMI